MTLTFFQIAIMINLELNTNSAKNLSIYCQAVVKIKHEFQTHVRYKKICSLLEKIDYLNNSQQHDRFFENFSISARLRPLDRRGKTVIIFPKCDLLSGNSLLSSH